MNGIAVPARHSTGLADFSNPSLLAWLADE
jgi:hypothetical protein